MNKNNLSAYLGFAINSGKIIFGYDNLFKLKKIPYIVLVCSTLNNKMLQKIDKFCNYHKIKLLVLENLILGDIIKRSNCKLIGVCDKNLSHAIVNELNK